MSKHHAPPVFSTVMLPQYAAWAVSAWLDRAALLHVRVGAGLRGQLAACTPLLGIASISSWPLP